MRRRFGFGRLTWQYVASAGLPGQTLSSLMSGAPLLSSNGDRCPSDRVYFATKPQISSSTIAPTIDNRKPAGWNVAPSFGFENNLAKRPPTKDPTMPNTAVAMKPMSAGVK